MIRKILALTLILTLIWHGWAWAAPPFTTEAPASITEQGFERSVHDLSKLARELRPRLDRSRFELEALLERLDYDPDQIVRFVTDEIALEIYSGTLRGPHGTLISRAGNALDQALLLATLLRDAGEEVVIRRGSLSEADAHSLVDTMATRVAPAASIWMEEPEPRSSSSSGVSEAGASRAAWIQAATVRAESVSSALKQSGIELGSVAVMSQIRDEARDYYWVEHRTGPSAAWRSVHPALGDDPSVAAIASFSGEIPAELTHRVLVEVLVANRRGSMTVESPLMAPIELVSANLLDTPLTFTLLPDQIHILTSR